MQNPNLNRTNGPIEATDTRLVVGYIRCIYMHLQIKKQTAGCCLWLRSYRSSVCSLPKKFNWCPQSGKKARAHLRRSKDIWVQVTF